MIRRIGSFEIFFAGPNPGELVVRDHGGEPVIIDARGMTIGMVDDLIAAPLPEDVKLSIFADQCEDASGDWRWRHLTAHERTALTRFLTATRASAPTGTDIPSDPGVMP